jgi:hypothetical protein
LFADVFTKSASLGSGEIITTFGSNRLPKAWQSHARGSGGHQTNSKPASVLANEASIEEENRQSRLTHDGIKGIIASAYRRPSQDKESRLSSCLKKINSTAGSKRKANKKTSKLLMRFDLFGLPAG